MWIAILNKPYYCFYNLTANLIKYYSINPTVAVARLRYSNILRILAAGAGSRCQLVPQVAVSMWLACESDRLSTTCRSCGLDIDGNTVPLARTKFQEPARVGFVRTFFHLTWTSRVLTFKSEYFSRTF
jgi:hypothetical protein